MRDPSLPRLVDSHCHLDFPDFAGDLPQIIARAEAAGVTRMVTICTRLRLEPSVRAIAEAHDGVFYAAGTHPMQAAEEPMATVEELVALSAHPKFVAGDFNAYALRLALVEPVAVIIILGNGFISACHRIGCGLRRGCAGIFGCRVVPVR